MKNIIITENQYKKILSEANFWDDPEGFSMDDFNNPSDDQPMDPNEIAQSIYEFLTSGDRSNIKLASELWSQNDYPQVTSAIRRLIQTRLSPFISMDTLKQIHGPQSTFDIKRLFTKRSLEFSLKNTGGVIPPSLSDFKSIKFLGIHGQGEQNLNMEPLCGLPLQSLYLTNLHPQNLPACISPTHLHWDGSPASFDASILSTQTNLVQLDLYNLNLTEIPKMVMRMKKLEKLDLRYNRKIKEIPQWLGSHPALKTLVVSPAVDGEAFIENNPNIEVDYR